MEIAMKINGYVIVYDPDSPEAMRSKSWNGYVYEHRKIACEKIGRKLLPNEVVHHINGVRDDNRPENLEVLTRGEHAFKHNGYIDVPRCTICGKEISTHKASMCVECSRIARRKVERPSKDELLKMLESMSMEAIGRKYGVSGNAVKKWAVSYKIR